MAFDRRRQPRLDHTDRRPFFFTPLESDNHGVGIAKDPMHGGQRLKPRKAVNVAKLSSCWHGSIVTDFPRKEKKVLVGNNQVLAGFEGQFYPLQGAKSPKNEPAKK